MMETWMLRERWGKEMGLWRELMNFFDTHFEKPPSRDVRDGGLCAV